MQSSPSAGRVCAAIGAFSAAAIGGGCGAAGAAATITGTAAATRAAGSTAVNRPRELSSRLAETLMLRQQVRSKPNDLAICVVKPQMCADCLKELRWSPALAVVPFSKNPRKTVRTAAPLPSLPCPNLMVRPSNQRVVAGPEPLGANAGYSDDCRVALFRA